MHGRGGDPEGGRRSWRGWLRDSRGWPSAAHRRGRRPRRKPPGADLAGRTRIEVHRRRLHALRAGGEADLRADRVADRAGLSPPDARRAPSRPVSAAHPSSPRALEIIASCSGSSNRPRRPRAVDGGTSGAADSPPCGASSIWPAREASRPPGSRGPAMNSCTLRDAVQPFGRSWIDQRVPAAVAFARRTARASRCIETMEWLRERGCPFFKRRRQGACHHAAEGGNPETLRLRHENGARGADTTCSREGVHGGSVEVLRFLYDNIPDRRVARQPEDGGRGGDGGSRCIPPSGGRVDYRRQPLLLCGCGDGPQSRRRPVAVEERIRVARGLRSPSTRVGLAWPTERFARGPTALVHPSFLHASHLRRLCRPRFPISVFFFAPLPLPPPVLLSSPLLPPPPPPSSLPLPLLPPPSSLPLPSPSLSSFPLPFSSPSVCSTHSASAITPFPPSPSPEFGILPRFLVFYFILFYFILFFFCVYNSRAATNFFFPPS